MTIEPTSIVAFLMGPAGTLFLALVIIYTGHKRHWVFGWYATELKERNNRLEQKVDELSGENRRVTSLAEKTAIIAEQKVEVTRE